MRVENSKNMKSNLTIPSAPLAIAWNFTYLCNMNCGHCYSRTERGRELTQKEQKYVLKKFIKAKVMSINFGGGESLLKPSFFSIAQLAKKNNISIALSSNGWLIDNAMAKRLSLLPVDVINISIDSADPNKHDKFRATQGCFKRAVSAIRLLKQKGLKVKIMSVLSRVNYREIEKLIKLAEKLKVDEIGFKNYKPAGKGFANRDRYDLSAVEWKKVYEKLIKLQSYSAVNINLGVEPVLCLLTNPRVDEENRKLINGSPCGKLSLCVKPNGDITPCAYINLVIGNILRDNLLSIWQNSPILYQLRNKKPSGKCKICPNFKLCLGGCFSVAYSITGRLDAPDPHCWWQPSINK